MSEGEFKKRIRAKAKEKYHSDIGEYNDVMMAKEDFVAIVAEAQQEWRDTDNYDKAHDELGNILEFGHQPTRDETIRILQYYLRRKNAWAHRWLGGEKAE